MATKQELYKVLYSVLKNLGLSDLEANVYIASLLQGPSSVSVLAKDVGVSRPNIYKVIKSLEKRRLAEFSAKSKYAREFIVASPSTVLDYARKSKEELMGTIHELSAAMPDLLTLYHQGAGETKVTVLQGDEQFRKTYKIILEEAGNQLEFFGSAKTFIDAVTFPGQQRLMRKRQKKGIRVRALVFEEPIARMLREKDRENQRKTRFMQEVEPFSIAAQFFANKVVLWQPKTPLALLIEDEYIVRMFRSIFEKLWKDAR